MTYALPRSIYLFLIIGGQNAYGYSFTSSSSRGQLLNIRDDTEIEAATPSKLRNSSSSQFQYVQRGDLLHEYAPKKSLRNVSIHSQIQNKLKTYGDENIGK